MQTTFICMVHTQHIMYVLHTQQLYTQHTHHTHSGNILYIGICHTLYTLNTSHTSNIQSLSLVEHDRLDCWTRWHRSDESVGLLSVISQQAVCLCINILFPSFLIRKYEFIFEVGISLKILTPLNCDALRLELESNSSVSSSEELSVFASYSSSTFSDSESDSSSE